MQARQINALMATSGMYQNAGEFAWRWGYRRNLALVAVLWRLFRMKWPSLSGVRN
ncbi:glutaminase [Escherichia coli]|nr:glutaminase [Escherichia coli]